MKKNLKSHISYSWNRNCPQLRLNTESERLPNRSPKMAATKMSSVTEVFIAGGCGGGCVYPGVLMKRNSWGGGVQYRIVGGKHGAFWVARCIVGAWVAW